MNELRILKNFSTAVDNLLKLSDLGSFMTTLQDVRALNEEAKVALEKLVDMRVSNPTNSELQKVKDVYSEQIDHLFRTIANYIKTPITAQTDTEKVKKIDAAITYLKLRNAELEAHYLENKNIANHVNSVFENGLEITKFNGGATTPEAKLKLISLMLQSCCDKIGKLTDDLEKTREHAKTLFNKNAELCDEIEELKNDPIHKVRESHARQMGEIKSKLRRERGINSRTKQMDKLVNKELQNAVLFSTFLSKDWENLNKTQFENKSNLEMVELLREKLCKLSIYGYEKAGNGSNEELEILWGIKL